MAAGSFIASGDTVYNRGLTATGAAANTAIISLVAPLAGRYSVMAIAWRLGTSSGVGAAVDAKIKKGGTGILELPTPFITDGMILPWTELETVTLDGATNLVLTVGDVALGASEQMAGIIAATRLG